MSLVDFRLQQPVEQSPAQTHVSSEQGGQYAGDKPLHAPPPQTVADVQASPVSEVSMLS